MLNRLIKPCVFVSLGLALFILNWHYGWTRSLPNVGDLGSIREAVRQDLLKASLVYVGVTVVSSVILALPGVTFAVFAGTLFGPFLGTVLCLIATTMGAVLSFWIGRYFLRDAIRPWIRRHPRLERVLFEDANRSCGIMLMVTRLVPLFPYNLQNFAYGITGIKLWPYTFYTFVFMAPGVAFFTLGASGLTDPDNRLHYLLLSGTLLVLVSLAGVLLKKRYIRRRGEPHMTTRSQRAVLLHQRLAFSGLLCTASAPNGGRARSVLFPGCSLSAYNPRHVLSMDAYLQERMESVGVLLKCCGKPLKIASLTGDFHRRFDDVRRDLDRMGAQEVIVACQSCYTMFRQFDQGRTVRSFWSLLHEMGLPPSSSRGGWDLEASVQDSCVTKDVPEIAHSVRAILDDLGVTIREMSHAEERARCCGYITMIATGDKARGLKAMKSRASESPCETVISYCGACRSAMAMGGTKSLHLLDLIFDSPQKSDGPKGPDGLVRAWINRLTTKRRLERLHTQKKRPAHDAGQGEQA